MILGDNDADCGNPSAQSPALITVVTSLPGLPDGWTPPSPNTNPNKVWNDKVIEPFLPVEQTVYDTPAPAMLFEQQTGQRWWAKLPGGVTLVDVEILDITLKTVRIEGSSRFMQPARYARTDIEFVEQIV